MRRSLEPAAPSPTRERVAALELQVAARARELTALQTDLRRLQDRYLAEMGPLYADLAALEAAAIPGGAPTFVTGVRALIKALEES